MNSSLKIAAAIAAALGANSAFAYTYQTFAADHVINLAGSSAFQTNLENNLATACSSLFKFSDSINNKSFVAYDCTVADATFGTAVGQRVLLTYRLAGGSVWGPPVIALQKPVSHIVQPAATAAPGPACPAAASVGAFPANNVCGNVGTASYNLNLDGVSAATPAPGLARSIPDWGISDVDAARLSGENWVDSTTGSGYLGVSPPTKAQLNNIANPITITLIGQVFSPLVNQTGPAGGLTSLSKTDISSIFTGTYTDWSQVPNATRTGTLSGGAIKICRRDSGSGSQALASIFFNGATCSNSSIPFRGVSTVGPGSAGPVIQNNSTGDLLTCVNNNPTAIGFAVIDTTQAVMNNHTGNVKAIGVDGITQSKANAASASYQYWAEAISTVNYNDTTVTTPGNLKADFILGMEGKLSNPASVTASDNLVMLVSSGAVTMPPTVQNGNPIAVATTNGNACFQFQSQN